jgi:hypothetical protein
MAYEVGLGDSPQRIAGYLSGNPQRYIELLAANPHKRVAYVGGMPTFESLGVGEPLNVPGGFIGDSLCEAFGVGTHEEAFDELERNFGVGATPESAFDALEQTFGTSDAGGDFWPSDVLGTLEYALFDFGVGGDFDHLPQVKRRPVAVFTEETEAEVKRQQKKPPTRAERKAAWEKKYGKKKSIFEKIGGGIVDVVSAPVKAVEALGKAAGKGAKEIGKVAKNVTQEVGKGLVAAAKFVGKTGGDVGKFIAKQAKNFAKDPMGALAKIATTGGLSLVGVDPQKALASVGIPTPDVMLKKLGLPTTEEVTTVAFRGITNPKAVLDKIPGINELTKYLPDMPDPAKMVGRMVDAALRGDLKALKESALAIGYLVSDVASMVPGVGNVIGGPLASAITLLETGSALKAALSLLLGQIPGLPPPVRDILRVAFNAIADIVEKSKSVTDVLLAEFKNGVKEQARKKGISGPIADVIESALSGAIQLIVKKKPLDKAALDIAKDGLEVARKNVAKGIGTPKELAEVEKTVSDLEGVYSRIKNEHAITQGIVKLATQDLQKKNPVIQKQISDLRASVEGQKLYAQSGAQAVAATLKKRAFESLKKLPPKQQEELRQLAEMKRLPPAKQEELRQLAAMQKMSPKQQEELRQLAALKKLSPEEQEAVREIAAMQKMSPEEQEELRQVAALKKLSPQEQQQLAAMSPEERAQLREGELAKLSPKEQEDLREIAEKKEVAPPRAPQAEPAPPAPAPGPMPATARAIGRVKYGPYPQAAAA